MTRTLSLLSTAALCAALAACSTSKSGGGKPAMGGSCHNAEHGLCFQYPKKELTNEPQQADICDNDPGATWRSGEACPTENVALECQYMLGPFLKEQRMLLYANNPDAKTPAQALAYCSELGYVPAKK